MRSVIAGVIFAIRGQSLLPAIFSRHDMRVFILEPDRTLAMCREGLCQTSPALAKVHPILHESRVIRKPKINGTTKWAQPMLRS